MRRTKWWILGLVVLLSFPVRPLHADPVGTSSFTVNIGQTTSAASGSLSFDNQDFNVFSNVINMSLANPVTFSGQVSGTTMMCTNSNIPCTTNADCTVPDTCQIRNGVFATTMQSTACSGCDSACGSCDPACPMCMVTSGSFICAPQGCTTNQPVSFVGDVTTAVGTILGSLPPDVSYTIDGTTHYQSTSCGAECVDTSTGQLGLNAFESITTGTGSNVTISTPTTFFNSSTGQQVTVQTTITFDNVTSGGTTTVTALSNAAGALPDGFAADAGFCSVSSNACQTDSDCPVGEACNGYHAAFFDISTTAGFTGDIRICSTYPDNEAIPPGGDGIVDGTNINELTLRLLHRPSPGADFEDVTLPGYPNPLTNTICGKVSSLSPFVVAVANNISGGGSVKTDCIAEWNVGTGVSTTKKGIPKNKIICKDNDPTCDVDPTVGTCGLNLGICPNQMDARLPLCTPSDIVGFRLLKPSGMNAPDPTDASNAFVLAVTLYNGFPSGLITSTDPVVQSFTPPLTTSTCAYSGSFISQPLEVPLKNGKTGKRVIKFQSTTSSGLKDTDKIVLICEP